MGEVRIFWNSPSFSMDIMSRIWLTLDPQKDNLEGFGSWSLKFFPDKWAFYIEPLTKFWWSFLGFSWSPETITSFVRNLHVPKDSIKWLNVHGESWQGSWCSFLKSYGSWQSWRWCKEAKRSLRNLPLYFCQDQTSWSLSRQPIALWSVRESWRTLRFLTKLELVSMS